jgi:hypothetical protein
MPENGTEASGSQASVLPKWLKRGRTVEVRTAENLWESGTVQSLRERDGRTWLKLRLFEREASFDLESVRLRYGTEEFSIHDADASAGFDSSDRNDGSERRVLAEAPPPTDPRFATEPQAVRATGRELVRKSDSERGTVHETLSDHVVTPLPAAHADWQRTAQALADLFALNDFTLYASRTEIDLNAGRVCFLVSPCLAQVDLLDFFSQECGRYLSRHRELTRTHHLSPQLPKPMLPESVFVELLSTITFLCDGEHQETRNLLACIAKREGFLATLRTYLLEMLLETGRQVRFEQPTSNHTPTASIPLSAPADQKESGETDRPQELVPENRAFVALNLFMTSSNLMDAAIGALSQHPKGISGIESGSSTDRRTVFMVLKALLPSPQFIETLLGVVLDWADWLQDSHSSVLNTVLHQRLQDELDEHLRLLLASWIILTDPETDPYQKMTPDKRLARHLVRLYAVQRIQNALDANDQQRLHGRKDEHDLALWIVLERWPRIVKTLACRSSGDSNDDLLVHFQELCTEVWGATSARQLERYAGSRPRNQLLTTLTKIYMEEPSFLIRTLNDPNRLPSLESMLKRLWEIVTECLREEDSEDEDEAIGAISAAPSALKVARESFLPAFMQFLARCHLQCRQHAPELFLQRLGGALGISSRRGLDRLLTVLRRLPLVAGRLPDSGTRAAYMALLHALEVRRREEPSRSAPDSLQTDAILGPETQASAGSEQAQSGAMTVPQLPEYDWSRVTTRDFGERTWYTLLSYRLALAEDKHRRILDTDQGKPSPFVPLAANEYLVSTPTIAVQADVCQCVGSCIPGICLNSTVCVECNPRTCPVARAQNVPDPNCGNMRFQRQAYASAELFFSSNSRGCGIRTRQALKKGDFIVEYMGEVIDHLELARRKREHELERHVYFMTLDQYSFLDASRKGTWGRFLNHACEPNCHTQKWIVLGKARVGIFASRAIAAGEELTFDYRMERRTVPVTEADAANVPVLDESKNEEASVPIRCLCGAPACSGWISGGPCLDTAEEQRMEEAFVQKRAAYLEQLAEQMEAMKKVLEPRRRSISSSTSDGAPSPMLLTAWNDEAAEEVAGALQTASCSGAAVHQFLTALDEPNVPFIPRRKRARPVEDAGNSDHASAAIAAAPPADLGQIITAAGGPNSGLEPAVRHDAVVDPQSRSGGECLGHATGKPKTALVQMAEPSTRNTSSIGISSKRSKLTCFACGQHGHKQRDCPSSTRPRSPRRKQALPSPDRSIETASSMRMSQLESQGAAASIPMSQNGNSAALQATLQRLFPGDPSQLTPSLTARYSSAQYVQRPHPLGSQLTVLDGYASDASCGQQP